MSKSLLVALLSLTISTTSFATDSCRALIVDSYISLGANISPMSFSSMSFEDFNISIEEFNALSAENQQAIYTLIKPLSLSVEEAIAALSSIIDRFTGTIFEIEYKDELEALKEQRELLRKCLI